MNQYNSQNRGKRYFFGETEPIPGQTIVEMCGNQRILIESHQGISECSLEKITVIASFGALTVSGNKLMVNYMSKDRILVCGQIHYVSLTGRGACG